MALVVGRRAGRARARVEAGRAQIGANTAGQVRVRRGDPRVDDCERSAAGRPERAGIERPAAEGAGDIERPLRGEVGIVGGIERKRLHPRVWLCVEDIGALAVRGDPGCRRLAGPKPDDRNPVGGLADRIVAESFDPIGRGRGLLELDQDRRRRRAGRARDGEESEDGDDQAAGWHRESSALN